jgi:hypothetical protein
MRQEFHAAHPISSPPLAALGRIIDRIRPSGLAAEDYLALRKRR